MSEAPGFATALRGGVPRRARRPRDADELSRCLVAHRFPLALAERP